MGLNNANTLFPSSKLGSYQKSLRRVTTGAYVMAEFAAELFPRSKNSLWDSTAQEMRILQMIIQIFIPMEGYAMEQNILILHSSISCEYTIIVSTKYSSSFGTHNSLYYINLISLHGNLIPGMCCTEAAILTPGVH